MGTREVSLENDDIRIRINGRDGALTGPSKNFMLFKNSIVQATLLLTVFAILSASLVAVSFQFTYEQILVNERAALLRNLNEIITDNQYDNELFQDTLKVQDSLLGTAEPLTVYRARKAGKPVAAIFTSVTWEGYNGSIRLLVGTYYDGTVAGVRVVSHQETPGLGDSIELRKSKWILNFNGHSLQHPGQESWKVKRDGGVFDQFTGATITPRAVVKAVKNTLLFYQQHREEIFN